MPRKQKHHLNALESHHLRQANKLLTTITEAHSHSCACLLCEARTLTGTQDSESLTIDNVVPWERDYAVN